MVTSSVIIELSSQICKAGTAIYLIVTRIACAHYLYRLKRMFGLEIVRAEADHLIRK